jgi:hypothetical protein
VWWAGKVSAGGGHAGEVEAFLGVSGRKNRAGRRVDAPLV